MPLARKNAFGVALLHAMQSMSTDIYIVALPLVGLYYGASLLAVQATMISFVIGLAVAHLFMGGLADYYGRRKVVFTGLSLYLAATLYAVFAPSIEHLIFARFLQGLATACGPIVMRAIVRDLVSKEETPKAFALTGLMASFGPILAPLLGSIAVAFGGWQMSLGALLLYASFVLVYNYVTLPETLRAENKALHPYGEPFKALKILLHSAEFKRGASLIFLGYGGLYAWLSTSSYILIYKLNYGQKETGVFIGCGAVCFMLGTFISNFALKITSIRVLLIVSGVLGCVGASLCAYLISNQPSIYLFFLAILPFYVGWGIMQPISMAVAMRPFTAIAGQASAWFGIAQFLGAMSLAILAGVFGGGIYTFIVMMLAMVGIAGIGFLWKENINA
jgi:MFS transporter, DHA1 family, multidrug resistance protein